MADSKTLAISLIISATDRASQAISKVGNAIKQLGQTAKGTTDLARASMQMGLVAGVLSGAAAAIGLPIWESIEAFSSVSGAAAHMSTAINDGTQSFAHISEAMELATKTSKAYGLTIEGAADAYYIARSNTLDHAQALASVAAASDLVIGTTRTLADAQAELMPVNRTLTTLFVNFGDKTKDARAQIRGYADDLAKLQTQFAFLDIGEVAYGLQYAMPTAKAAGVNPKDFEAVMALLSASGLHGAEAGTGTEEILNKFVTDPKLWGYVASNKTGGVDVGKTIGNFSKVFGGMSPRIRAMALSTLGFDERSVGVLQLLMSNYSKYGEVRKALDSDAGAAAEAARKRQAALDEQWGRATQKIHDVEVQIGAALSPAILKVITVLGRVLDTTMQWMEQHKQIVKFVALFAGMTAVILGVSGALLGLFAAGAFVVSTVGVPIALVAGAIAGIGVAAAGVTAFLATFAPTVLTGLAGLGVALFDSMLKPLEAVKLVLYDLPKQFLYAGYSIIKNLAEGILGVKPLEDAASKVGKLLKDYFWGHSPPPLGPLHQAGRNTHIIDTIASSLNPAPAVAAARRVAAAMAIALPLAMPMAIKPYSTLPAVASISASRDVDTIAQRNEAERRRPIRHVEFKIEVNQKITVGSERDRAAVTQEFEKYAYELVDVVKREFEREDWSKF